MNVIYPMFALVVLTFCVGLGLGVARTISVRRGQVDPRYYRLMEGARPPEQVVKLGRNFSNLLEVPVLFYVFGAIVLAMGLNRPLAVALAWLYVALRLLHSSIHLTYNHPVHRFVVFLASSLVLLAMWIWLVLQVGGAA